MTEYTRPATWDDLVTLVSALEARGARYALIGGYAVAAHGYNRFSEDLDILVDPSPDNTPAGCVRFSFAVGARPKILVRCECNAAKTPWWRNGPQHERRAGAYDLRPDRRERAGYSRFAFASWASSSPTRARA